MAKIDLNTVSSGYLSQAALNNNFTAIENEFQNKVLYRDNPSGEPNSMQNDLDMNGHFVINAGNSSLLDADNIAYTAEASAAESRTIANKLNEFVSVKDFGAVGDGVTDDTAAIQAAIDSLGSSTGGTIYLPAGVYRTTSTIVCNSRSATLNGDGADSTVIKAEHSTGAVVRFYRRFSGLRNIGLSSSGARAAATNTTGFGVHFECEDVVDSTTIRMQSCFCDNVSVQLQPGTGFYWVGPATQGSMMQNCYANANRGHGFAVDRGILSGRTNAIPTAIGGCMTIDTCLFYSNLGHGVACAAPTDAFSTPALRVVVENCEFSSNATSATVRYTNHQVYFKGTNFEMRASVVGGATTGGGVYTAGRNHWIRNNRFLECTHAVQVGYYAELPTQGINIEGMTVINTSTPSMDPAVVVDAGASNVRILQWLPSSITSLVTPNVPGIQIDYTPQIVWKTADESVNNSAVLQNDEHLKWYLAANENIFFVCVIEHSSVSSTPDIQIAFTIPSGASMRWGPSNGIKIDASDTVVAQSQTLVSGTPVTFGSANNRRQIVIEGTVENGSTEGFLQLQWAQATATVGNTNVYGNASHMRVWRKY